MGRAKKTINQNEAYDMPFPTRLRALLKRPGVTQEKLAKAIHVNRQSVSQWKDGITSPDINILNKIAGYFNVSADYLLGRTNVTSPEINTQGMHQITGLTESAIDNLGKLYGLSKGDYISDEEKTSPTGKMSLGGFKINPLHIAFLSSVLESRRLKDLLIYVENAAQLYSAIQFRLLEKNKTHDESLMLSYEQLLWQACNQAQKMFEETIQSYHNQRVEIKLNDSY